MEPTDDGARVRHAIEVSGRIAGPMRWARIDRRYQHLLDREVERVIELAGADAGAGTRLS